MHLWKQKLRLQRQLTRFLHASHVTRTRRAHQITASSLYILLKKAFLEYQGRLEDENAQLSFEDWCSNKSVHHPQFKFWFLVLQIELAIMIFIRAVREGIFQLYIDALTNIVPWFFAVDHIHYARWIPVHLRDMISLEKVNPTVFDEFKKGNFVVRKTARRFSAIAIDQTHEQNNAAVKGDVGAIGLTENPAALRRWMMSGPEMARVIGEFEMSTEKKKSTDFCHHEETKHVQKAFKRDIDCLAKTIEEYGNPLTENSSDLLVLDKRNIAQQAIVDTVFQIEQLGQEQYDKHVRERLVIQNVHVSELIMKNNLPLFSRPLVKKKNNFTPQLASLKSDCSLFSRLYVSSQVRGGNLDEFFEHENQACPPALLQNGEMRTTKRSDLVGCLEDLVPSKEETTVSKIQVSIIDGSAIVNILRPGSAQTFLDYAQQVFLSYIVAQLQHAGRVDIVWGQYFSDSLKGETRRKRGVRRRVQASSTIPGNWQESLALTKIKLSFLLFW